MSLIFDFEEKEVLKPLEYGSKTGTFLGYGSIRFDVSEKIHQARLEFIQQRMHPLWIGGNEDLQVDLGVLYDLMGEEEKAEAELRAAIKQDPDAHYPLGKILLRQKLRHKKGSKSGPGWTAIVNHLKEALACDPENSPAQYYLGKATMGMIEEESEGTTRKAFSAYLEAGAPIGNKDEVEGWMREQDVDHQISTHMALGEEAFQKQDWEKSYEAFEKAKALGSKEAVYHLGKIHHQQQKFTAAFDAFQEAKSQELAFPDLEEKLADALLGLFSNRSLLEEIIELTKQGSEQRKYLRSIKRALELVNVKINRKMAVYLQGEGEIKDWIRKNWPLNDVPLLSAQADSKEAAYIIEVGEKEVTIDQTSRPEFPSVTLPADTRFGQFDFSVLSRMIRWEKVVKLDQPKSELKPAFSLKIELSHPEDRSVKMLIEQEEQIIALKDSALFRKTGDRISSKVDIELTINEAFEKPVHAYLVLFENTYTIHTIAQSIFIRPDQHEPGSSIKITPKERALDLGFRDTDPWGWVGIKVFISPIEINIDQFKQGKASESSRAQTLLELEWQLPQVWTSEFLSFNVDLSKA